MEFTVTAAGLITPIRKVLLGVFMAESTDNKSFLPARDLLNGVRDTCDRLHIASLKRRIDICAALLEENPPIDVAILGQFKAGKSSFINSLLGKPILPTGVVPVTTVITRLQYGPGERAAVTHFDGSRVEIPLEKLADFTSEVGNPDNGKNVEVVDVDIPAMADYPGLRLVDTPGMGSVFKIHMKIAQDWLPEVGAAIVAVSSDRPLSDNDLELIRELTRHTPNIILLLTKVDLLLPDQRTEVVQFLEKTLEKELGKRFPVFCFSTRVDTEQYNRRIEMEILLKLSTNRDIEFRNILRHKVRSLASVCINYLEIALKSALQADRERDEIRRRILDERLSLTAIQEDLMLITRENSRQTRTFIMQHLGRLEQPLREKLTEDLRGELPRWKGNLWRLTRRYEEWLTENMTAALESISRTENRYFLGTLKKSRAAFDRALFSFRALLGQNIETVLGLKLAEADWRIEVAEPSHPDVGFIRVFDFHFDLLWFLIPMFLFRKLFEKHFLALIPRAAEMNLSRLGAQWESRINVTIEEMRKQAAGYVKDEIATIEALLEGSSGRTEEIQELIAGLQERLADLSNEGGKK
jgi:GTP-binding protein EngB required for normal cell division